MKLVKRIASATLAAGMAATLLAGCGQGGTEGTPESSEAANTYTMFMRSTYVDWLKELKWYDEAEARTGIHVEYVSGPEVDTDVYSEVDQRIISGDLTDAVMTI